ncbi:MAG: MlaD family protein [Calditrichia bacterium]
MEYKSNEIKTGLMLVVSLALLTLFLVTIFGIGVGNSTNDYKLNLEYIGGITEGSLVKYVGMDVGQVTSIGLTDNEAAPIEVQIIVNEDIPVRVDSRAFITALGIMSENHIEISPGSNSSSLLPTESVIPTKEVAGFPQLAEDMGNITGELQTLMTQVNSFLGNDNQSHLTSIVGNMDTLMSDSRLQMSETVRNFRILSERLNKLTGSLDGTFNGNKGNIDGILANLKNSSDQSNELLSNMQLTLASLQTLIDSNNANVVEILDSYQISSQNLEDITRMLKERPWMLIRKAAPSERDLP